MVYRRSVINMKKYDLLIGLCAIVSISTIDLYGETIRALITGIILGVYIGWRLCRKYNK